MMPELAGYLASAAAISALSPIVSTDGFENFHIDAGEPAPERPVPDPSPLDVEKLMRVGAQYGCSVLGPRMGAD